MPGYPGSNPDHAVNLAERMRHTALHVIAGQRGDYELYWRIVNASFEPWTEGEWTPVELSPERELERLTGQGLPFDTECQPSVRVEAPRNEEPFLRSSP